MYLSVFLPLIHAKTIKTPKFPHNYKENSRKIKKGAFLLLKWLSSIFIKKKVGLFLFSYEKIPTLCIIVNF
jgi:hypothetical protein